MWTEIILSVVFGLLTLLLNAFFRWLKKKVEGKEALSEAVEALAAGTAKVQTEFIRELKDKAADKKLTKQEIKDATVMAAKYAMEEAKGPALELIKTWSSAKVESLIKRILKK